MKWTISLILCLFAIIFTGAACNRIRRPADGGTEPFGESEKDSSDGTEGSDSAEITEAPETGEAFSADFTYFKISRNHMMPETEVYEGTVTDEGLLLQYYISSEDFEDDGGEQILMVRAIRGDESLLREVSRLFTECGVESWDGFDKTNPDVTDGTSLSVTAELPDGREIHAYGCNTFPQNSGIFLETLYKILCQDTVEEQYFETPSYRMTLPLSWVGKVQISYSPGSICFEIPTEQSSCYLVRMDLENAYRTEDQKTVRIGRLVRGDQELFLSACCYGEAPYRTDIVPEDCIPICENLEEELAAVLESIEPQEGYELIPEEGESLYEDDARSLFNKAKSLYLDLYLAGEFAGGVGPTEIEGAFYRPMCPRYDTRSIHSLKALETELLKYFSKAHTEKTLEELKTEKRAVEYEKDLYVRFDTYSADCPYASYSPESLEQIDKSHALLSVSVYRPADSESGQTAKTELLVFEMLKNQNGSWVFDTFPLWGVKE